MHSKRSSILKRWHSLTANPGKLQKKWAGQYWEDESDGLRNVACSECRSFNRKNQVCSINFGTPLRKCVASSIEAHLNDCKDKNVLEIGFGRYMLARNLIRRGGGTWTGIDPGVPRNRKSVIGQGGHGEAASIPFTDNTFDIAFGIQSIEHWGQKRGGRTPSDYRECMAEVHRVLRTDGSVYFDAPIYFHGHEMFIMNDLEGIRSIFSDKLWTNIRIEKWRERYTPLDRYPPSQTVINSDWPVEILSYDPDALDSVKQQGSVFMIAITADKR